MNEQLPIDQRTRDLLNGGVDGELDSGEQVELDGLLAESTKLNDQNKELKSLAGLLDNLPEVEPPTYLQESIERQIRLPAHSSGFKEKKGTFATWLPAHWMRTGFALAAGAVLTITIYEMGAKPLSVGDFSNLSGTIAKQQASNQGALLDSADILTDTLTGSAELRSQGDLITLDVQLISDGPTQVVVDFADRGLEFIGVSHVQDRQDVVSVVDGSVKIAITGEQRYTMNLRKSSDYQLQSTEPLELEFFSNDLLVHEAELRVSQQDQ